MPTPLDSLYGQWAVCDTNTLVSAALLPESVPGRVLAKLQLSGRFLFSLATFDEFWTVLQRPKFERKLSLQRRLDFVDSIRSRGQFVPVTHHITACRDPKDDKFLSLALAAHASHLITGDADLLTLHPFQTIHILTPRDFLAL